jgi:hypothetical protein
MVLAGKAGQNCTGVGWYSEKHLWRDIASGQLPLAFISIIQRLRLASVKDPQSARHDLDTVVVSIELTLVSIIQGISCYSIGTCY